MRRNYERHRKKVILGIKHHAPLNKKVKAIQLRNTSRALREKVKRYFTNCLSKTIDTTRGSCRIEEQITVNLNGNSEI